MTNSERFTAAEREALRFTLQKYQNVENIATYTKILIGAAVYFRKNPLRFAEAELRRTRSGLYLIASPMTREVKRYYTATMPFDFSQEFPFGLNVLTVSRSSWEKELSDLGVAAAENMVNLEQTGFMSPRKGTDTRRSFFFKAN